MTGPTMRLRASGWSVHLPGVDLAATLPARPGGGHGAWASEVAAGADRAATVLGRKGLLAKEPATRLALCAVHRALALPAGRRPNLDPAHRTAVIACSDLGNVATVAQVVRTVADQGGGAVSILDAPNVSSNVVATAVALWFGFGGPNLMVCSGSTSGWDGLRLAGRLLAAGRADRVVLVGAEPDDEVASALHAAGQHPAPLRAAAACLILEATNGPNNPADPTARRALIDWHPADDPAAEPQRPALTIGPDGWDPVLHWGDSPAAQGVVAVALAAHLAVDDAWGVVGATSTGPNGSGTALVQGVLP